MPGVGKCVQCSGIWSSRYTGFVVPSFGANVGLSSPVAVCRGPEGIFVVSGGGCHIATENLAVQLAEPNKGAVQTIRRIESYNVYLRSNRL